MTEDFVYPEDQGTNANLSAAGDGDDADAANFGSYAEAVGNTDYVVRGLNLQNVSSGTFDLTAGKAVVTETSADAAQSAAVRDQQVAYVVEVAPKTGLSYTTSDISYVYLDVLLTDDNALDIVINTTETKPSEPSIKIAEIDDTV
jgi:hypothetical protein